LAQITLIKTQFLELKKVRFTSSFAFYSIFKIRAFPLISEHIRIVPSSKCSIIVIRQTFSVKSFFQSFETFFQILKNYTRYILNMVHCLFSLFPVAFLYIQGTAIGT